MKRKNKLLFGLGISLLPISIMAVTVSCSAPLTKDDANKEAEKVTLDFTDKATTLASAVSKTSTFVKDKFNEDKYELQVQSVTVGTDKKSIVVTFRLKVKNTKVESKDNKFTITGFKEEPASTPKTEDKKPEDKPKPGGKDGASGAGGTIPKDKDKEKSETKSDTESATPEIKKLLTELKTHLTQKLSDLIDKTNTTIPNGTTLIAKIKAEFAKSDPQITFDASKLSLKIGTENVDFKQFSLAVAEGLAYIFKTNGGDFQKLNDALVSNKDNSDNLLVNPAVKKFSDYLKKIATFEANWEETLKKAFKEKTFEVRIDLDKSEIYVKNSVTTTDSTNASGTNTAVSAEFKKIITFKKEFVDGVKKTIKETFSKIVEKLIPKNTSSTTVKNKAIKKALEIAIKAFINSQIEKIWKGKLIIKKDEKGKINVEKVSTQTTNTVAVAPATS